MKTIYHLFSICIFILSVHVTTLSAQFACASAVEVTLGPDGTYTLFPEDLLTEGDLSGFSTVLLPQEVNCTHLAGVTVVLEVYDGANLIYTCSVPATVLDETPPVALCQNTLEVTLDGNGSHILTVGEIDAGSYDNCDTWVFSIQPQEITCASDNPQTVLYILSDVSGNVDTCTLQVAWDPYPNPVTTLACNAFLTVSPAFGEQLVITPDFILEGGPYGCPDQYIVTLLENNVPRPQPVVSQDDAGKTFVARVTDVLTQNSCWGELGVLPANCDPLFTICDTECRTYPLGDCASGHTDQDHIEWPCDIFIIGNCDGDPQNLSPNNLIQNGYAIAADAYPQITDPACYLTSMTYDDLVYYDPSQKKIERRWTILYWLTGQTWIYTQEIVIQLEEIVICDTAPWNTPTGDCLSGHTLDDNVEWPADITLNTFFTHPDDLELNAAIASEDVRPRLFTECSNLVMGFLDLTVVVNDSLVDVQREWYVYHFLTGESWSYIQHISVEGDHSRSQVCTFRENGEVIPDVMLTPTVINDPDGCYLFEEPNGIIVTPVKDAPLQDGVNILDKVLMLEHILGIKTLSPFQLKAADLSQDGIVSTLDAALLDKLIEGTFTPTFLHNWMFFDRYSMASSMNISNTLRAYPFIGVKMGDIDNSYSLGLTTPLEEADLLVTDEILNETETYQVPFRIGKNIRVSGFSLRLENASEKLSVLEVSAPWLPGFSAQEHVTITGDHVDIVWIAPDPYLLNGIAIPAGSPLFEIRFISEANTILSEELILVQEHDNVLQRSGDVPGLALTLVWENKIVSPVTDVAADYSIRFFPNPVTDMMHLDLPEFTGHTLQVADPLGRQILSTEAAPILDLRTLQPGLYTLTVSQNGTHKTSSRFVKL